MTQEKQLLLVDLSARVPYDVKCKIEMWKGCDVCTVFGVDSIGSVEIVEDSDTNGVNIERIKPYLFPLSSMTKEQEEEFKKLYYRFHESAFIFNERFSYDRYSIKDIGFYPSYLQDWLIKNHFDYRGLISMGLAIDATGLNIY